MPTLPLVLDDEDFTASPCIDCDVPGYLVLQPRHTATETVTRIAELSPAAAARLGLVLGGLERAISTVTGAEHVYILRFSEGLASVHFHLFPRTAELASQWLSETQPAVAGVNGPQVFAWARLRYHVASPEGLSSQTLQAARAIGAEVCL